MDAKQFLAEFKHIVSAPDGVKRLREMILSLAFQGNLCEYDTSNSSNLLSSLAEQRLNYYNNIERDPRRKTITVAQPMQPPYSLPEHWRWLSLSEVGHNWGQKQPITTFTYIDVSSIDNQRGQIREPLTILSANQAPSRARKIIRQGSIIYSTVRPYLLNIALIARGFEYEPIASTAFAVIHPWEGIVPKYLYYYLRCPQFSSYVQALQSGIAYPAISDRNFFSGPVPIPPTKEQKRIVTKIDELMALCDKLEAQQQERESLGEITRIAVLDSVTTAQDSIALSSGWTRVRSNIRLWLENEDAVTELRNAVTFLGCRGLLTEIVAIDSLELRETGFALPLGWSWTTLRQLSDYITSGSRSWSKFIAPQGDIFIRSQDIKQDFLVFENTAFVNLPQKVEGQRTLVRPGDLLITITGANVGKCAQVPLLSQKAYVSQHVALVRVKDVRHTPFLHWWITNAFGGQKYLSRFIYGDKPGLNLSQVGSIPIPFPPQDVQSRIVEALVHYRNLCDRLSTSIRDSRTAAKILATTAVSSVTGIRIQEQEKMRVPKTELVSNLRIGINPPDTGQAQLASILSRNNDELPAKTLWNMSGLEIDDFYQQLKLEMAKGWIVQPETAYVQEVGTS